MNIYFLSFWIVSRIVAWVVTGPMRAVFTTIRAFSMARAVLKIINYWFYFYFISKTYGQLRWKSLFDTGRYKFVVRYIFLSIYQELLSILAYQEFKIKFWMNIVSGRWTVEQVVVTARSTKRFALFTVRNFRGVRKAPILYA